MLSIGALAGVPLISLERLPSSGNESLAPRSTRLVEEAILAAGVMPEIALRLNDYRSVSVMVDESVATRSPSPPGTANPPATRGVPGPSCHSPV